MRTDFDPGSGNPACAGPDDPFYLYADHMDLEHDAFTRPADGTAYFFFWYSTKTQPGFYDQEHTNARPLGYVALNRTNGVWSIATCVSDCASSVLFLPGIESSRLYMKDLHGFERQLWEPSFNTDIPLLALNVDGTSVNEVYTKDIIDSIYGLPLDSMEVYSGFQSYLDEQVTAGTIHDWRAYPYDWRYDVRDVVRDGTLTEVSDQSIQRVYVQEVLAELASSSPSGKVTIIGHSNGGLLGKALLLKLQEEGKEHLVDQFIMVGTPQWGTPKTIGSMLHGDDATYVLGIVMYGGDFRVVAKDLPGAYTLLPSKEYFSHIGNPVATFADDETSGPYHEAFLGEVDSFNDLVSFVTDGFNLNSNTAARDLSRPTALRSDLMSKAEATQDALNAWIPADGLEVTSIVGWGQLTTYQYSYAGYRKCPPALLAIFCTKSETLTHPPLKTEDGDDTVVAQSAAGNEKKQWYFDASAFEQGGSRKVLHRYMTSAFPIQDAVTDLLTGYAVSADYIVPEKPQAVTNPLVIIGIHSPANPLVTDARGNQTGVAPVFKEKGIYAKKSDIPGSAVDISGEEKYIYLPAKGEEYTVSFDAYDTGNVTVDVTDVDESGVIGAVTTFAHIQVTDGATASFSVKNAHDLSPLSIDLDGNGVIEATLSPIPGATIFYADASQESMPMPIQDFSVGSSAGRSVSRIPVNDESSVLGAETVISVAPDSPVVRDEMSAAQEELTVNTILKHSPDVDGTQTATFTGTHNSLAVLRGWFTVIFTSLLGFWQLLISFFLIPSS